MNPKVPEPLFPGEGKPKSGVVMEADGSSAWIRTVP